MGIKWHDFQLPKRLECEESTYTNTYGKFVAAPFERGFSVTLGNSLRRTLLSSIEGSAVTWVKIDKLSHEFSSLPGLYEDIPQFLLNIRNIILISHSKIPHSIYIKKNKAGEIKAKDLVLDESIEVVDSDLHLATLNKDINFNVEMEVARGRGFVLAQMNRSAEQPVGVIPIDSNFNPVKRVNFFVENTRVGQRMDYEKLTLEIFTNGGISPKDAMLYAANILQRHLDLFVNFGQLPEEEVIEEEMTKEETELYEKLKLPISELELSVRSSNCLRQADIKRIAELATNTEDELMRFKNFGKKSLNEIKELLNGMNLHLGLKVDMEKLKRP